MTSVEKNKRPLKIVCLTPHLFIGGAERLMIDIFSRLDRRQFEPYWCCLSAGSSDAKAWQQELAVANIKVKVLSTWPRQRLQLVRFWRAMVLAMRLWRYLWQIKPDILQTQLLADVYRPIGRLAGVKKIVGIEHNIDQDEVGLTIWLKKINRWSVDQIIAVSEAVKQDIRQRYHYPAGKIEVIYNGIDWNKFYRPLNNRLWPAGDDQVWQIGAIGRLTKQKGFDILIQALAQLPTEIRYQCSIAGTGQQAVMLQELIERFKLSDKVKLVGHQADVPAFFKSLDVLIVPSRWEGLGLVVLEAGAAGVPVIASAVDGIKEIITHQVNGYLIPPGDIKKWVDNLAEILSGNQSQQLSMWAVNLQQRVQDNFFIDQTVQSYQQVYNKLVK